MFFFKTSQTSTGLSGCHSTSVTSWAPWFWGTCFGTAAIWFPEVPRASCSFQQELRFPSPAEKQVPGSFRPALRNFRRSKLTVTSEYKITANLWQKWEQNPDLLPSLYVLLSAHLQCGCLWTSLVREMYINAIDEFSTSPSDFLLLRKMGN